MRMAPIVLVSLFFLYGTNWFSSCFEIPEFPFVIDKFTDSKFRQIILLFNSSDCSDLPIITTKLPTIAIGYQKATEKLARELSRYNNPQSTLIAISLPSVKLGLNNSVLENFLTQLIGIEQRPKVLMITTGNASKSYHRKFLKVMWSRNFLDVTSLIQERGKSESVIQRYFNPFTRKFTKKRLSVKMDLFPDKLKNLHGHQIKVGYFHFPPYVSIVRNKSDVLRLEGFDYQLLKIFSEVMNFRISEVVSNKTGWDIDRCEKEKNTGLSRALMYNEIQLIGVQTGRLINPCYDKFVKHLENNLGTFYYSAVTPITSVETTLLSVEFKVSFLLSIVSLLMIIWIFPKIVHFETENWQMMNLFRMMLGIGVLHEPKRAAERIFFASILITCCLYSSEIFSSFTSINLGRRKASVIDTMNELYSSNLTPIVHSNLFLIFETLDEVDGLKYIRKSSNVASTDEECIEYLRKYKNVTCFMREFKATLLANSLMVDGRPVIHKVKENLAQLTNSFVAEPGFPYVAIFRKIFTRLQESGIANKWYAKYFNTDLEKSVLSETDESSLIRQMIFILGFGFVCSILTFIGELLLYRFQ